MIASYVAVKQPNRNYTIFDWHSNCILEINLHRSELLEYFGDYSDKHSSYTKRKYIASRYLIASIKKDIERQEKNESFWPSWEETIRLAHTESLAIHKEENTIKIKKAVELGLVTESKLEEMYLRWKEDQVPLLERKIIPLCVLRTPVKDLELSIRVENCLNRLRVKTIGDLIKFSEKELLRAKYMGKRGIKEIEDALWSYRILLRKDNMRKRC